MTSPTPSPSPRAAHEWDAETYHRISRPQFEWGVKVLAGLALEGGETVMDAGCGTGRLTALLLERLPRGRVLALDRSENMLRAARQHLLPRFEGRVEFLAADLGVLDFADAFDVVFSTATFHWVKDHPGLFARLWRAIRPGVRLHAQCGGGPNLKSLRERTGALTRTPPFATCFAAFEAPWHYPDEATTSSRLEAVGFVEVVTGLEPAPTTFADAGEYRTFVERVVLHPYLVCIADPGLRERFLATLVDEARRDRPPLTLDYWRLNLSGRKPQCSVMTESRDKVASV